MKNIIFAYFLLLPLQSVAQKPDSLDAWISRAMESRHIPGLAMAVIKNGQVVKQGTYGLANVEKGEAVQPHTVFEIASMTKQFTCAAILLLEQEGKLQVSDPLWKFLPDLPDAWQDITLYQLMNHTAGLYDDWVEPNAYFQTNNTTEKMLAAQLRQPLLYAPGRGFYYSSGPFFLGLVIEKLSGMPYARFMQQRLFAPLHMSCTAVYADSSAHTQHAKGYWWVNGSYQAGVPLTAAAKSRADVGIVSCITDMVKWCRALQDTQLLQQTSLEKMFTAGMLHNGMPVPYGMGWYMYPSRGHVLYEHGGAFRSGFTSRILLFPNDNTEIILLCNLWRSGLASIANGIAQHFVPGFSVATGRGNLPQDTALDKRVTLLMQQAASGAFAEGQLYQHINVAGYDSSELRGMLEGYDALQWVAGKDLSTKPLSIYNQRITAIHYYRTVAHNPMLWAVHINSAGDIVVMNPEE